MTATRKENESAQRVRHVFPSFVIVKPPGADVYNLHFYLKPRISLGMVSSTGRLVFEVEYWSLVY